MTDKATAAAPDTRRPATGEVEQRSAPTQTAPPTLDGRRLRGVIPYGVESRDLGGWREIMQRGSLAGARTDDLVATVDHGGVPLARFPTTLEVEDRDDGLHWSLELPESRADVREAVERGDLRATSWRMVVSRDRWAGELRHVEQVAELRDVSLVTNPAYSAARAEYRSAAHNDQNPSPESEEDTNAATERQENENMPDTLSTEDRNAEPDQEAETREGGSLQVEDRAAEQPTAEQRVDDSDPSIVDVLTGHLAQMLALKLDSALLEGNPASNADSIRGIKYVAGIQTVASSANGDALTDYDRFVEAVGLLAAANVPGPYVAVGHPRTATALALLRTATGSNEALARPAGLPQLATTTQISTTETKGTSSDASSVYVFAPSQLVLVRRQDASIELDRSRLFSTDQSELRGKLRADLLAPNPQAIVRIEGVIPA